MRLEYKDFICDTVELKQRHVETFAEELLRIGTSVSAIRYAGEICRAAIRSGWIASPPMQESEVGELSPRVVRWLSGQLSDLYAEATRIEISLLEAAALHAEEPKKYPAPRELIYAWRTKIYGVADGNGWMNEEAGLIDRMTSALNVYESFVNYKRYAAEDKTDEWIATAPGQWEIVQKVLELRKKNGG